MPTDTANEPTYLNQPLGQFLESVAACCPAPGGGAALAVGAALAAGLVSMAARFAGDRLEGAEEIAERMGWLQERLGLLAQSDGEAYGQVLEAIRLPRDTKGRRQKISRALSQAADGPLAIVAHAAEVVQEARGVVESGNPNLEGDAMAAVFLAEASVRGAAKLVEINLRAAKVEDGRLERVRTLRAQAMETVRQVEWGEWGGVP